MRGAGKGFDVSQQIHTYCGVACVSKVVQRSVLVQMLCVPCSCQPRAEPLLTAQEVIRIAGATL